MPPQAERHPETSREAQTCPSPRTAGVWPCQHPGRGHRVRNGDNTFLLLEPLCMRCCFAAALANVAKLYHICFNYTITSIIWAISTRYYQTGDVQKDIQLSMLVPVACAWPPATDWLSETCALARCCRPMQTRNHRPQKPAAVTWGLWQGFVTQSPFKFSIL